MYEEYNDAINRNRNREMLEVAKSYLESGDTVFFAVGLAHLLVEEGLVEALQDAGYNVEGARVIPVFGVDATDAAQAAIAEGSMTGTIKQDAVGMANAVVLIAQNLMAGKDKFDSVVGDLEGTWRVNIPYSAYNG